MSGVPPLKPLAYYRAVDLLERKRSFIARRRLAPDRRPGVRILGYHRISNDKDVLAVTPEQFQRQLDAIVRFGATIVRLDEALTALKAGIDRRYVCLTFDDGYLDNLTEALPILREFDAPATLYVPTQLLDGHPDYYWYASTRPPALAPNQLADLAADGTFDIQSHSWSHPSLPSLNDTAARREIIESRSEIEQTLGGPVTSFSYPAGLYGPRDVALVQEAGYAAAVTTRAGLNVSGQPALELHRTMVSWADGGTRFRAKLDGLLDRPSRLTELAQLIRARR